MTLLGGGPKKSWMIRTTSSCECHFPSLSSGLDRRPPTNYFSYSTNFDPCLYRSNGHEKVDQTWPVNIPTDILGELIVPADQPSYNSDASCSIEHVRGTGFCLAWRIVGIELHHAVKHQQPSSTMMNYSHDRRLLLPANYLYVCLHIYLSTYLILSVFYYCWLSLPYH